MVLLWWAQITQTKRFFVKQLTLNYPSYFLWFLACIWMCEWKWIQKLWNGKCRCADNSRTCGNILRVWRSVEGKAQHRYLHDFVSLLSSSTPPNSRSTQSERTHLEAFKEFVQRKIMFSPVTTALDGKCKAIPLKAWTDREGSRRLRLPGFKTIGTWKW
jgi:hypothetical protein